MTNISFLHIKKDTKHLTKNFKIIHQMNHRLSNSTLSNPVPGDR